MVAGRIIHLPDNDPRDDRLQPTARLNRSRAGSGPRPRLPDTPAQPGSCRLRDAVRKQHRSVTPRCPGETQRSRAANLERRQARYRKREFKANDFVLVYAPQRAEKLPNHLPRIRKMLDRFIGPFQVVRTTGAGPRKRYVVFNAERGTTEEYRGESLSLYTPWDDEGHPSVPEGSIFPRMPGGQ